MRLLIHTLAWLAAWPVALIAGVFWSLADVRPAGVAGVVSGVGFLILGFLKFSDRWDEIHSRARARHVHALVQRGHYEREAS